MNEMTEGEDHWRNFSHFEQESLEELENGQDYEKQLDESKDLIEKNLWTAFQTTATTIAQLYKDRHSGLSLWVPFQNAASNATALYKECIDSQKKLSEIGSRCGYQRRNKELAAWVKKRKKNLRREDLIAFLTGKGAPHWPRPRKEAIRSSTYPFFPHIALPHEEMGPVHPTNINQEFKETLPNFGLLSVRPQNPGHRNRNLVNEYNSFVAEDFAQNVESRKKPASNDVTMDSPTHKRSRYT